MRASATALLGLAGLTNADHSGMTCSCGFRRTFTTDKAPTSSSLMILSVLSHALRGQIQPPMETTLPSLSSSLQGLGEPLPIAYRKLIYILRGGCW